MPDSARTTTPPPQDTEFDPLEFWIRYKSRILLYGGILAAVLAVVGVVALIRERTKDAAEAAYASAKTADDFRKVIADYPRTIDGANAQLRLAEVLAKEGKADEAVSTLRGFITEHPDYPLIAGAYLGLGSLLENQGKMDEALAAYQKITLSYLNSYPVPMAWMGQARVLKAKGKTEEARRAYETVIQQFGDSSYGTDAKKEVQSLEK